MRKRLHRLVLLIGLLSIPWEQGVRAQAVAHLAGDIEARLSAAQLNQIRVLTAEKWISDGVFLKIECPRDCRRFPIAQSDWFKIFLRVADVSRSRIDRVVLVSGCDNFQFSQGHIAPESGCTGSSYTSSIVRPKRSDIEPPKDQSEKAPGALAEKSISTADLNSPPASNLNQSGVTLSQRVTIGQIEKELVAQFKTLSPSFKILDRSDYHVRVVAQEMRNVVLPGEWLWERLSILVVLSRVPGAANEFMMHLVADGNYAGGLGSTPPESSYTNSMEPKFYRQLDEFTKGLSTRVVQSVDGPAR